MEDLPNRIKMFLWLAILDKPMHNVNWTQHGFPNNPSRYSCKDSLEDIENVAVLS